MLYYNRTAHVRTLTNTQNQCSNPRRPTASIAQTVLLSKDAGPLGHWSGILDWWPHRTASLVREFKVLSGESRAKRISATAPPRLHQDMMQRIPLLTPCVEISIPTTLVNHAPGAYSVAGGRQTLLRVLRRSIARGDDSCRRIMEGGEGEKRPHGRTGDG